MPKHNRVARCRFDRISMTALGLALMATVATPAAAQDAGEQVGAEQDSQGPQIADIVVTAQRRDSTVQDTSAAISAFSAESIETARILSFEDLAGQATSLSFTALSPIDQEFNIRGITNTRLDSPSADQSIGIFVDDVYVGRSGLFNFDMYDIERVEVVRGPQGVLLGRNVVGGAISIYSARPEADTGGSLAVSYGNYNEKLARGHITGTISGPLTGRLSFQYRNRDGFNKDLLHDVDLDDIDSIQFRGQLMVEPEDSDFTARLVFDYTKDDSNGFHSVAIDGPAAGSGPWSAARAAIGTIRGRPLKLREGLPEWPRYKGDTADTPQQLNREAWGLSLRMDQGLGGFGTLSSITGYRKGEAFNVYDQTGIGPDNGFGVISPTLFTFPVNEDEDIRQFSQELRVVSEEQSDRGFDWIFGAYYQHDKVTKIDRFWAEVPLTVLTTLSGESRWNNRATNESYAFFGQLGYRFSPQLRIVAGVRYSKDRKGGTVTGIATEGGDKFNPNDQVALTPLAGTFREGQSFTARYSDSWSEITPQATIEFKPNDDMLFYGTFSTGYKGGGFEDDPANAAAAVSSYDPETVTSFEIGGKVDLFDRRLRLNVALFDMKYKNLQVTQTSAACLCNITDNAADAKIQGIEAEATVAVATGLTLSGGLTLLDTKYIAFIDSLGNDNSGNFLQRTPKAQWNVAADFVTDIGDWSDALRFNVNYSHQARLFWAPDNLQREDGYGQLGGRVSFTPGNGDITFSLWGRNLTNTLYRTNIIAFFGDEVSRLGAPRQYGAEVSVKF
jgi:iron complex outermembrane recepter protein